jgi:hypothetical protein
MSFRKSVIAGAILGATTGVLATPLSAAQQVDVPSNPNILAAVQQIQATLQGLVSGLQTFASNLQTTLTNIQTSINNLQPTAPGNVAVTPPVNIISSSPQPTNEIICTVFNLTNATRSIDVQLVGANNALSSFVIPPGGFGSFGNGNLAGGRPYYCKFTVVNGTKADITASITELVNSQIVTTLGTN